MVSGRHLTIAEKEYLYRAFTQSEQSPDDCLHLLFGDDTNMLSLKYLTELQRFFKSATDEDIASYIYSSKSAGKPGPKLKIAVEEAQLFMQIVKENPKPSHAEIAMTLAREMGGQYPVHSNHTIARGIDTHKMSCQVQGHVSALLDDEQRWATLDAVKHKPIDKLHNMDESSAAARKFMLKQSYDEKGHTPIVYEWTLTDDYGVIHSVIADYTPFGWTTWRIFYGNVNHSCVERFLSDDLASIWADGDVQLYDGASIHTFSTTLALLDRVTGGRHVQVAAYSHDQSPVERGFANVWGYIRHHWKRQTQSAVDILNEAFWMYSVQGPWGNHGK